MIGMLNRRSQDGGIVAWSLRQISLLGRLKGLANGVNPRWGARTVVVSVATGDIIRFEERGGKGRETRVRPRSAGRARLYL